MKRWMILLLGIVLIVSACSTNKNTNKGIDERIIWKEQPESPLVDSDKEIQMEQVLREQPGQFAGRRFNQTDLQKAMDQFPQKMPANEAYKRLRQLLAEDYQSFIEKMQQVQLFSDRSTFKGTSPLPINVVILLDASARMKEQVEGKEKIWYVKEAMKQFAAILPPSAQVSLRIFGHKGTGQIADQSISCRTTESVYPLNRYHPQQFQSALSRVQPSGGAPMAKAMMDAGQEMRPAPLNVVYVISTGKDTCKGDPVEAAKKLQTQHKAKVHIIGFQVKTEEQNALQSIAKEGGGNFVHVDHPLRLQLQLEQEATQLWLQSNQFNKQDWEQLQLDADRKLATLGVLRSQLFQIVLQERNRMLEAAKYLSNQDKVLSGEEFRLFQMIMTRGRLMENVAEMIFTEKKKLLRSIRNDKP